MKMLRISQILEFEELDKSVCYFNPSDCDLPMQSLPNMNTHGVHIYVETEMKNPKRIHEQHKHCIAYKCV